jgi:BMFP domain-containing protein YqiC
VATKERKREVELSLLHFLRRGALRLQRAVESLAGSDSSSRATMSARLVENAAILGKMKDLMQSSEEKIQSTENELKQTIHGEIDKALDDLLKAFRLQRNPGVVNQRLKQLYEYIVARMKASLEDLYAQLGNDFDAVLDDKRFVEERELHVEYDLSDVPQKIVSSLSFAYLAAIFFGISVGLFAGAAYFASQVISNKRSLKEYFMNATVSEETLAGVKADLLAKTDNEIEYAIDFVRQSIVQRIDVIQRDVRNITYAMTQSGAAEIEKSRGRLEALQARINGFLADRTE